MARLLGLQKEEEEDGERAVCSLMREKDGQKTMVVVVVVPGAWVAGSTEMI